MKLISAVLFLTVALNLHAQQDQKLADGSLAYYGEHFPALMKSGSDIDREILNTLLNDVHVSRPGKPDLIGERCLQGSTCYSHVSVGYDRARKIMFGELDVLNDIKGMFVIDVYCGKRFYFRSVDDVSNMSSQVNIEHTWPQSRFNGKYAKDMQKSDMHHLYPSDSLANNVRGNSPFGFVSAHDDGMGGEGCRKSRYAERNGAGVYTPPASHRGNVARALFYFSVHYNLPISRNEEQNLRNWHEQDPIDSNEIRRHEMIAKYQKVRNPFIDFPELVDRISDF